MIGSRGAADWACPSCRAGASKAAASVRSGAPLRGDVSCKGVSSMAFFLPPCLQALRPSDRSGLLDQAPALCLLTLRGAVRASRGGLRGAFLGRLASGGQAVAADAVHSLLPPFLGPQSLHSVGGLGGWRWGIRRCPSCIVCCSVESGLEEFNSAFLCWYFPPSSPPRWYFNVKHLQYLKCREKLSLQLLQAVPHFGAALLHISRLGCREGSKEVSAQGVLCRIAASAQVSLFSV